MPGTRPGMTKEGALTRPAIGLHWPCSEGSSDEELRDRTLKSFFGMDETAVTL